jgi:quaternary ammonium compound-resistance protein SugE
MTVSTYGVDLPDHRGSAGSRLDADDEIFGSRLWWSLLTLAIGTAGFLVLSLSLESILIGTAYSVWTSSGTVGAALVGILFFNESRDILRLVSIALIVAGIVGLKISHGS